MNYGDDLGSGGGNFKKGAFKPIAIVLALVAVAGGGIFAALAIKGESDKVGVKEVAAERKEIYLLSKAEQVPRWREWAARDDVPALQQEAFVELAWARDAAGLESIIKGLASNDHRVRGTAAQAITEYGTPAGDAAKPALLKALKDADNSDRPQICWALATLREASAFDAVLESYRLGHLAKVQRIDGHPAFDPEVLSSMVPLEKLAALSGDESESVRQLVATVLSRTGDARWATQLTALVQDPSIEVAREAAVGLGRIANEESLKPLLATLDRADKDSRPKFLEALRDGVGTKGLVLAIKSVSRETPEREKLQTRQLFDMMRELQDPRGADALVEYLGTNPKPHWRTEAALRLAEVGDVRAAPHLGWRLKQDPLKLYNKVDDPELVRDDNERVVAARMLADLAVLHPDKRADILAGAEDGGLFWSTDLPQPHANGLRFLAAANSQKVRPLLRKWANPHEPLPKAGAQGLSPAWTTAQSALRYLGWTRDEAGWGILTQQLNRRPPKVDATMDSLMQGGLASLGMTLRALGVGASDGFAQWGDSKAYPLLTRYIEDPENNEQSRIEACFALSWVATDEQLEQVVKKVHDYNKPDPKSTIVRTCYLETLVHRPVPSATKGLVSLLTPDVAIEVRHQAARAIGFGGVAPEIADALFAKLKDESTRGDAALALLVGGNVDQAQRAIASYNDAPPEAAEELKTIYNQSFGYWSDKNYEKGDVARWIRNAEACTRVKVGGVMQDWPKAILSRAIQGIEFDNGPHSMTRVQFRMRLYADAKQGDDTKRGEAIQILKFMKEKGVLMALRAEPGGLGELARAAFFEIMNPKVVDDRIPDAPKAANDPNTGAGALPH